MEAKTPSLEITIISAEDLRLHLSRPIKKNSAFATVRSGPNNSLSTRVDQEGGTSPCWNEKLHLALHPTARSFTVEVHCKAGFGSGSKLVGSAEIPVSDIVEDFVPAHQLHFLSYRLREQDGERNGIVNLSVRMLGPDCIRRSAPQWRMAMEGEKEEKLPSYENGIAVGVPVGFML